MKTLMMEKLTLVMISKWIKPSRILTWRVTKTCLRLEAGLNRQVYDGSTSNYYKGGENLKPV